MDHAMPLQPAIIFAGELFEKEEALAHAKGLLLDFFCGRQVSNIALKVCAISTDATVTWQLCLLRCSMSSWSSPLHVDH